MKLRFLARYDILATDPTKPVVLGQPIARIGRTFEAGGAMPATKEAAEYEIEPGPIFEQFRRLVAFGDVWCADEETAKAFGADMAPIEFKDGVWIAKIAAAKPAKEPSK